MIHVRGAVDPLVRARQRRHRALRLERRRVRQPSGVELGRDRCQRGRRRAPVVERRLQRARDLGNGDATREIARDDDELAVARAVLTRRKLHREPSDDARRFSA